MWCYQKSTPWNYQNKPCHEYKSMNNKSNDIDPFHMIVSCCSVLDLANIDWNCQIWPTACFAVRPGCTSFLTYHGWLLICTEDWKPSFYAYALHPRVPTLPIAVYCCVNCWGVLQCQVTPVSPTKINENHDLLVKNKQDSHPPVIGTTIPCWLIVVSCVSMHWIPVGVRYCHQNLPKWTRQNIPKSRDNSGLIQPNTNLLQQVMAYSATHLHPEAVCKWLCDVSIRKLIKRTDRSRSKTKISQFYLPPDMKIWPPGLN